MGLKRDVKIIWAEAANKIKQFAQNHSEFEFVFIDHAHGYSPVYAVCCELKSIVKEEDFAFSMILMIRRIRIQRIANIKYIKLSWMD